MFQMAEKDAGTAKKRKRVNWKIIIMGVILLALALAVMLRFAEFGEIGNLLKNVNYYWLLAALGFQLADYAIVACFYKTMEKKISYWYLCRTSIAMSFLDNTLPSFSAGGSTLLFHSIRKKGSAYGKASFILALNAFLNFVLYFSIFACGMIFLIASGKIRGFNLIWIFAAIMILILIAMYGVLWTAAGRKHFKAAVSMVLRRWPNVRKKAMSTLASLHISRGKVSKKDIFFSSLFLAISYFFRIGVVALVFLALGYAIPFGILIAGYFITSFISVMSYVRMGVQEATMAVSYSKLGVPYNSALTATLLYRLVSFWIIILLGFFAFRSIIGEKRK